MSECIPERPNPNLFIEPVQNEHAYQIPCEIRYGTHE